jgi:O6-methylguanine-DNA--protein-cysteine methyltransferase
MKRVSKNKEITWVIIIIGYTHHMILSTCIITSPIGELIAIANQDALVFLDFRDSPTLQNKIRKIEKYHQSEAILQMNPILEQLTQELSEYFEKKRNTFCIPMELSGTDFQEKSWK